jgi:hypothetical protein
MYTIATIKQLQAHLGITQPTPTETDRRVTRLGGGGTTLSPKRRTAISEPFVATLPTTRSALPP